MQHGKKHKVLFNNEASVYFGAAVCHFLLYSGKTGHLANRANSQQASMDFSFSPGSVKTGSTAAVGVFLPDTWLLQSYLEIVPRLWPGCFIKQCTKRTKCAKIDTMKLQGGAERLLVQKDRPIKVLQKPET